MTHTHTHIFLDPFLLKCCMCILSPVGVFSSGTEWMLLFLCNWYDCCDLMFFLMRLCIPCQDQCCMKYSDPLLK